MSDLTRARFLALGDSYTIGECVGAHERWPAQLVELLRAAGAVVGDAEIVATTGWTTDELRAGIAASASLGPYDLVTLLIGVNNQYRGRPSAEYRDELRELLAQAVGLAGGRSARVIVVSIPDWGVTTLADGQDRRAIGRAIDEFNAIGRDEATAAGASFVDITPTSRERRPEWEASDGFHPGAAQYAVWARLILPAAQRVLERPR